MRRYFGSIVSVTLHGAVLAAVAVQSGIILPRVHSSGREGAAPVYSVGIRSAVERVSDLSRHDEVTLARVVPEEPRPEAPETAVDPVPAEAAAVPEETEAPGDGGEAEVSSGGTGRGEEGDGPGDGAAVEVYNPPPQYPPSARRRGIEGEVLVEISIGEDGSCAGARIVESSGSDALDDASLAAVRTWTFRPAIRGGRPVPSTERVRFVFKLES